METHRSVKIVLTVSYALQIASSTVLRGKLVAIISCELILHTYVEILVHFSFVKDLVLVFI